jgi:hypothetical protein
LPFPLVSPAGSSTTTGPRPFRCRAIICAEFGRWTARDPIGLGGGDLELYGYVVYNPIELNDPKRNGAPWVVSGIISGVSSFAGSALASAIQTGILIGEMQQLQVLSAEFPAL